MNPHMYRRLFETVEQLIGCGSAYAMQSKLQSLIVVRYLSRAALLLDQVRGLVNYTKGGHYTKVVS